MTFDQFRNEITPADMRYLAYLVEKDQTKPPLPDEKARDQYGHRLPRCVCGRLIQNGNNLPALFCPECGRRWVEDKNDGREGDRKRWERFAADGVLQDMD